MDEGTPDRRKGLVMGIFGGLIGAYVMLRYQREVLPMLFPDDPYPASGDDPAVDHALPGRLYQPGETAYEAGGRFVASLLQAESTPQDRQRLGDLAHWAIGLFLGITYGATRTSTLPRDFAGGFFYGIRIWLGDEIIFPLLGLRTSPKHFTRKQHFALLTTYWVYSFVTTNTTRLLYRLFSPEDW
jgi:hypothetical protein